MEKVRVEDIGGEIIKDTSQYLLKDNPFDKKDVEISVQEGKLRLKANQKSNNDSKKYYWLRERHSRSYDRSFTLPDNIVEEKISAIFKNGSLRVLLPKAKEVKPIVKKIKIS